MIGSAQLLFRERTGEKVSKKEAKGWLLLEGWVEEQVIAPIDLELAKRMLLNASNETESIAALLCHLMRSSREGHLCVHVDDLSLQPSPLEETGKLSALIRQGAKEWSQVAESPLGHWLVRKGSLFYLKRHWDQEVQVYTELKRLLSCKPQQEIDLKGVEECGLTVEQQQAVRQALSSSLTLLTGGPGTGKTFTAGHLIRLFLAADPSLEVALAAPTGKAAANLQRSLSRAMSSSLQASTLHRLLKVSSRQPTSNVSLTADLILVDESSMIDVGMMARLLGAVKSGARLILLGDKDQLPPVESGGVFADLAQKSSPLGAQVASLTCSQRTDSSHLLKLARATNSGDIGSVLQLLDGNETDSIQWAQSKDSSSLVRHIVHAYPSVDVDSEPSSSLIQVFDRYRVLSPLREGPLGVDQLNEQILSAVQRDCVQKPLAIPIMITVNDYGQGLFNGETGVLIQREPDRYGQFSCREGDYALFSGGSQEEPIRRIPALLLPKFELAYAVSVHKSQGSEFEKVLIVLPEGSELFGREVLYTAITRAKKSIEVYGEREVLSATLSKQAIRQSGLMTHFNEKDVEGNRFPPL